MNTVKLWASAVIFLALVAPLSFAGTVEVNWHEPDKYTDIESTNGGKKSFQKSVIKQMNKHWQKMATKMLPENVKLKVKVTNLDLAGDVRHNFSLGQEIRLIKSIHWPSIEFEYELLEDGKLIKKETVKLKDMAFMERGSSLRKNSSYYYDKRIITDWFTDDIQLMLAQWKKQQSAVMS